MADRRAVIRNTILRCGNMDDMFRDDFRDIFHHGESGGRRGNRGAYSGFRGYGGGNFRQKGQDLRAQVEISFDEAAFGCDKVIRLQDPSSAGGAVQSLQYTFPAGIDTGKTVRLKGKGMPGVNGGESGDLLLGVTVREKEGYERKGMDVYTTVQIPFTTAVFGGEAVVSTLYGNVLCKIRKVHAVRYEDPAERQRNRVHEKSVCARRPVCHSTDSGTAPLKPGSGEKAQRVPVSLHRPCPDSLTGGMQNKFLSFRKLH